MDRNNPHLLVLPYDIRHLIYKELFPPGRQIYIQALPKQLRSMTAEHSIPTALLSTCRQLHSEASEFLYNSYLFNIVGEKPEVLALYGSFSRTVEKYARHEEEVHVDPFSNGKHSGTMCISIHTGDGKIDTLTRRQRGIAMKIQEVKAEVGYPEREYCDRPSLRYPIRAWRESWKLLAAAGMAVMVAMLAWWFSTL